MNSLLDELQDLSDWQYRIKFAQIVDRMEAALEGVTPVDRIFVAYMLLREYEDRYNSPVRFGWASEHIEIARHYYVWQALRVMTLGLNWDDMDMVKGLVRHILCGTLVPNRIPASSL